MKQSRFVFSFGFRVGALLWLVCGIFFASKSYAADAPNVSFTLSNERVITGEPVFLNYTITNPTTSRVQAIWIEDVLPNSWLEARLTDETGKDAAAPLLFENQWKSHYAYGKRFKKNTPGTPRTVIFLKPGGVSHGRMALTSLVANAPKVGLYQIQIKAQFRWADAKDVASFAATAIDFSGIDTNMRSQATGGVSTYLVPPTSLATGAESKTLRFVITSTDRKVLMEKAKALRETILTASGEELSVATDTLAAWPEATALEAWLPLAQEELKKKEPDYLKFICLHSLLERIRWNSNAALLPFMEALTWKLKLYDQHSGFENLYASADQATQKKIEAIYAAHNEAFPEHPKSYPD